MLSERPWTVERVAMLMLALATGFCLFGVLESLAGHFSGKGKLDENSVAFVVFTILALHGSILLATAFVLGWNRLTWRGAFGFARRSIGRSIGCGALAALLFLPVGALLQWLSLQVLTMLHRPTPVQEAIETLQHAHNPVNRALLVVFAVAIAPVAEEMLFRGILYPAIKRLGFPRVALWSTALLFAAIHASLPIFLALVALAVALTLLYEYTDNLLAPIVAHAIFNAVNLLEFFYSGGMTH
jgi:membrane protease YdiL (CAAX protease family)